MKVAYPGSFNPWHNGHQYVYDQLCKMFDKDNVYIILAINQQKKPVHNDELYIRKRIIFSGVNINWNTIIATDKTVAAVCKEYGIEAIGRGIRSGQDATSEFTIADWNLEKDLQTIFIYCGAGLRKLSSSAIRELHSYGEDVSSYMPKKVHELWIKNMR